MESVVKLATGSIRAWLIQINMPVAIFIAGNGKGNGEKPLLQAVFERISGDRQYQDKVRFALIDADRDQMVCAELSVIACPILIIFQRGQEQARFVCHTSEPAMRYHLDEALRPPKTVPSFAEAAMPWF